MNRRGFLRQTGTAGALAAAVWKADGLARVPTPLVGRFLHHARRARRAAHRDVGAAPAEGQA